MARRIALAALLAGVTFALYAPVDGYPFVSIDDSLYVTGNERVQRGFDLDGVRWALTNTSDGNWLPVTWLSHMLDVEWYGLDAGGHHRTSRWLHTANAVLVFALLALMTGRDGPALLVAGWFALHPTRVESVAWVAERKDVLSAFFGLLALLAYLEFARRGGRVRYALVGGLFALALMAKSMLVTLPCVMLLLDVWPLGRLRAEPGSGGRLASWLARHAGAERPGRYRPASLGALVREKLPLFALVAFASAATFAAQRGRGAMVVGSDLALPQRLANALVSYLRYVADQLWPVGLSTQVPHPYLPMEGGTGLAGAEIAAGVVFVALATGAALYVGRGALVGWGWFAGMLVPVIGLVQVGPQGMADRYTYLPSVGLAIAIVYGAGDWLFERTRRTGARRAVAAAVAVAMVALAFASALQLRSWRDSRAVYRRSLAVDPHNLAAHFSMANEYKATNEDALALAHYRAVLERQPRSARALNGSGVVLRRQGRLTEAARYFEQALAAQPGLFLALNNLGNVYRDLRRYEDAELQYRAALRSQPDAHLVRLNLGNVLRDQGRDAEALAVYLAALEARPRSTRLRHTLAELHLEMGEPEAARAQLEAILALDPSDTEARHRLDRLARDAVPSSP